MMTQYETGGCGAPAQLSPGQKPEGGRVLVLRVSQQYRSGKAELQMIEGLCADVFCSPDYMFLMGNRDLGCCNELVAMVS